MDLCCGTTSDSYKREDVHRCPSHRGAESKFGKQCVAFCQLCSRLFRLLFAPSLSILHASMGRDQTKENPIRINGIWEAS